MFKADRQVADINLGKSILSSLILFRVNPLSYSCQYTYDTIWDKVSHCVYDFISIDIDFILFDYFQQFAVVDFKNEKD